RTADNLAPPDQFWRIFDRLDAAAQTLFMRRTVEAMKSKNAALAAELSGLTAAPGQTAPAGLDDLFARLRASLTPETAPRLDQLAPRFGGFGVYAEAAAELFGPDAMLAVAARRIPDGV